MPSSTPPASARMPPLDSTSPENNDRTGSAGQAQANASTAGDSDDDNGDSDDDSDSDVEVIERPPKRLKSDVVDL